MAVNTPPLHVRSLLVPSQIQPDRQYGDYFGFIKKPAFADFRYDFTSVWTLMDTSCRLLLKTDFINQDGAQLGFFPASKSLDTWRRKNICAHNS